MWFTLLFAVAVCIAVLYVPGYLVGRALSFERTVSLAVAPAFSLLALVVLGVAFRMAGISCHALALAGSAGAIGLIAFGLAYGIRRKSTPATAALPLNEPEKSRGRLFRHPHSCGRVLSSVVHRAGGHGARHSFVRHGGAWDTMM